MQTDMTVGKPMKMLLNFTIPVFIGNVFQQLYSMADAVIVGKFVGTKGLAAVGATGTITFLIIGFLMGLTTGFTVLTSQKFGAGRMDEMRKTVGNAAILSAVIAVIMTAVSMLGMHRLLVFMHTPEDIFADAYTYSMLICSGVVACIFYNLFSSLLRAIGNSVVPLLFLAVSAVLNVILDLVCVLVWHWGVRGAAAATTFSQFVSGIGIGLYTLKKFPQLCPKKEDCRWDKQNLATILNLSVMTSVQQSIMNFGILMVQGLVNSFGTVIMAAFAAAVKIDSFAYMPVQDFGNAFSTYVAQNYGAGQTDRIRKGIRSAGGCSAAFCIVISVLVCAFAAPLMGIFIDPEETAILAAGVHYLHIEGACYLGIGILFLLYGYYRAVNQPQMSVVLTITSLGTRVALAYLLSATPLSVTGIWLSVPIGWALADAIGIGYYLKKHRAKYAVQA